MCTPKKICSHKLSEMVKFELISVVIIVKNSLYSILQITVIILVVNACSRTMWNWFPVWTGTFQTTSRSTKFQLIYRFPDLRDLGSILQNSLFKKQRAFKGVFWTHFESAQSKRSVQVLYRLIQCALRCLLLLLARPLQDVFLLPLFPWIKQGGGKLLVMLCYDRLCDGFTILSLMGRVSTDHLLCAS